MNNKKRIDVEKVCEQCSSVFIVGKNKRGDIRRFCSKPCSLLFNKRKRKRSPLIIRICEECGGNFITKDDFRNKDRKVCSNICRASYHAKSIKFSLNEHISYNLTEREKEVIDGILLADGDIKNLYMTKHSGVTKSSSLRYTCKYKETLLDIIDNLPNIDFYKIGQHNRINNIGNKILNRNYYFSSRVCTNFYYERLRWYPENKKIVPKDIRITPVSCYWWYIGDGSAQVNSVKLYTNGFTKEDVEFLAEKLMKEGFKSKRTNQNTVYISNGHKFINWLAEHNKISPQYLYKWTNIYHHSKTHKVYDKQPIYDLKLIERNNNV